jgi:hypothetical protein
MKGFYIFFLGILLPIAALPQGNIHPQPVVTPNRVISIDSAWRRASEYYVQRMVGAGRANEGLRPTAETA